MNSLPAKVIDLPKISDARGNLTFIESDRHIPFAMKRAYYIYEISEGATRGGHAHRTLHEFIIAASGRFTVVLDDGQRQEAYVLDRADQGLYVPPMFWRELTDFAAGSVCLVLTSDYYDESDYYRDYDQFLRTIHEEA